VFYPHPGGTLAASRIIGASVVLVLITLVAVRLRRAKPYLLFGWLWYLVTLLPVIGLVQVGEQGMADRYTYVPLVGIFIALSWGANDLIRSLTARGNRRDQPRIAMASGIAAVSILIGVTRFQVRFWNDGDTLFTRALAVTEGNDVAHEHLGTLRAQQGRFIEADTHFREAVRIRPKSALAHLALGSNLIQLGKADEALAEYRAAVRLDPSDPRIHTNLGGILERQGNFDEARSHFEEALRLDASFTAARVGLGTVLSNSGAQLAQLGRYDEAYARFAEAIRVDPQRAETQCDWGTALATQSRYREAAAHFTEAIRLSPGLARAHFSLAAALFFLEDYAGAWREVRLAERNGYEPPPGFLSMLSAKKPEPR
jgi:tetratricopeptide (TPR) repeat protein